MPSPDHLFHRAREKTRAVKALDDAIARIAREGREPDPWERLFLLQGIRMLSCGNYAFASIDAELAATPVSERTPGFAADACSALWDLKSMTAALRQACSEPLQAFPETRDHDSRPAPRARKINAQRRASRASDQVLLPAGAKETAPNPGTGPSS